MRRRARISVPAFEAVTIEGALIAAPMLAKIATLEADGQSEASYRIRKGLALRDEIAARLCLKTFPDLSRRRPPRRGRSSRGCLEMYSVSETLFLRRLWSMRGGL